MTKSNVNPNHYKVAGRERQGEEIAQARNKQRLAESLVASSKGPHARFPKPATAARPARTATTPAPKPAATSANAASKTATKKAGTSKRHG